MRPSRGPFGTDSFGPNRPLASFSVLFLLRNYRRAKTEGIKHEVVRLPWAASGRALGPGRSEGGAQARRRAGLPALPRRQIVGIGAGDVISEAMLALEMGADAQDIALTIHPHSTVTETVAFSAEPADASITALMPPRGRARASASA
jgi:dihydrolipoamide dehydrogenase